MCSLKNFYFNLERSELFTLSFETVNLSVINLKKNDFYLDIHILFLEEVMDIIFFLSAFKCLSYKYMTLYNVMPVKTR